MAIERDIFREDTLEEVEEHLELDAQHTLLEDGGVDVEMEGDAEEEVASSFDENLAEILPDDVLEKIAEQVLASTDSDKESRATWENTLKEGLKLLGTEITKGTTPFEGACTATHPLIIESGVKYQSKTIQEIFQAGGLVRTMIMGKRTDEKEKQATRIKDFLNYQLVEEIPDYYTLTERILLSTSLYGT